VSRNNLNTIAIENFLQSVKVAQRTSAKELKLDAKQYRDLADSISMVMTRLVELQDSQQSVEPEVTIQMDGGKL
jgi:hypothetical protein